MFLRQYTIKNLSESGSSLPNIIEFAQYRSSISGTFGDSDFPFLLEIPIDKFNPLDSSEKSDIPLYSTFQYLRDILAKEDHPSISKGSLESRFHVFEIEDYGNQSMTPGLLDFIPVCYTSSGSKISQRLIGLLRFYLRKKAYILIPKGALEENPKISVDILFKSREVLDEKDRYITFTKDGDIFSANLMGEQSDISLLESSLIENNPTQIFDFILEEKNETNRKRFPLINSQIFVSNALDIINGENKVSRQSSYFKKVSIISTYENSLSDINIDKYPTEGFNDSSKLKLILKVNIPLDMSKSYTVYAIPKQKYHSSYIFNANSGTIDLVNLG